MHLNDKTVTIIGAGLADLSAAYELQRAGWKVTVLEARPRLGGRVYSIRTFTHGQVAEGGGEFIDSSHKRMIALANDFNLKLGRVGSWQGQKEDWGSFEGKAGPLFDPNIWGTNLQDEVDHVWKALSELGILVSDPHPLAKSHFIQHIRAEYTAEPERFSLLDLARNSAMYYTSGHFHENFRVVSGNDLIEHTATIAWRNEEIT